MTGTVGHFLRALKEIKEKNYANAVEVNGYNS